MDQADIDLRNVTYTSFVELGRAPTAQEVAARTGCDVEHVLKTWRRLHDAHALVLSANMAEIRMANPFSAVPTAYRVNAASRWWFANCAWDAFGIFAALHADGRIECVCPDCSEPLSIRVESEKPDRTDLLFHCLVSAKGWWDDIVFT